MIRYLAGRLVALGAIGLVLSLAALGLTPANAAAATQSTARPGSAVFPAPPQIHGLDFLLGKHECRRADEPTGPIRVRIDTQRELDGHYYYADLRYPLYSATLPDTHAVGVYGWNPVDGTFILQYHDNWGSSGSGSSPGWQGGHLRFTGELLQVTAPSPTGVAPGFRMGVGDDWQILGPGHFAFSQTATLPDGTTVTNAFDCYQTR